MRIFKHSFHALTIIILFLLSTLIAISGVYGVLVLTIHKPAFERKITALTQEVSNTNTLNLELLREIAQLKRNCQWSRLFKVLSQESQDTISTIDEILKQMEEK